MSNPVPPPKHGSQRRIERRSRDSEHLWTLDVSAVAVGGLVLFLILTRLRFDDPRLLYNAKTYLVAVPSICLALALVLRSLASRYLRKSIQLGFLFSVCIHLLLLIFAIHYVVFSAFQPLASTGKRKDRSPIQRTVPEHVFQTPQETQEQPDWSEPVESETRSREIPEEERQLPPVERTKPRLEVPKPKQFEPPPMQKYLMERAVESAADPMPADAPGKLARKTPQPEAPDPISRPIDVPTPAESQQIAQENPADRVLPDRRMSDASRQAPPTPELNSLAASQSVPFTRQRQVLPSAASVSPTDALPTIGEAGLTRSRRSRTVDTPSAVAGAAPAPINVAVARESPNASMSLNAVDVPLVRSGTTTGAQITANDAPSFMAQTNPSRSTGGTRIARRDVSAISGVPNVNAPGTADRAPGRGRRVNTTQGFAPAGSSNPIASVPISSAGTSGQSMLERVEDRLGEQDLIGQRRSPSGGARIGAAASSSTASPSLDLLADPGPIGIGQTPATRAGIVPSDSVPEIAAMELPRQSRIRREVGGLATPAGTKIAAVEAFSRRVMRTSGGPSAATPGAGGPDTDEAIERGLAYLASIQNEDGSWSLQGHGEEVVLHSDTAATGLCLLAFQGYGYTHQQHQYSGTVGRGLKFLLENQRSSGNLYRAENEVSDRNVMFYSHGIAALALCEAYGMTQDRELRFGAQESLNFIAKTQHRTRGGWRYTPQVSSDTSVTGWMMMALKSGELSGLEVPQSTYEGIDTWLGLSRESDDREDRYRYNPFAPDTPEQRHGRLPTPTMTAVGILMRMYNGWQREHPAMQSAADYLLRYPPRLGDRRRPLRDGYYWYYATQVMFHMGGQHWERWNDFLNPLLVETQIKEGPDAGSWDPVYPVPDRWSVHAGRLYVTTMNLLNLEVYYRHLPIYEDTAAD